MSNPLRKMYETSDTVEKEGIIIEYAPGVELRVARAGGSNKRFTKEMARLCKPYRRAIQTETINEEILTMIFQKAYARTVILGWKGFTKDIITKNDDDADIELPFNEENCMAVLAAQQNLFQDIVKTADNISLFRAEINEVDSGN